MAIKTKVKTTEPEISKLPMGAYPDVPELEFMHEIGRDFLMGSRDPRAEELYDRLRIAWRYLWWSRRYSLIPATRDEHTVAIGFVTKYHRLLYNIPLTKDEEGSIARAEAAYKARKRF